MDCINVDHVCYADEICTDVCIQSITIRTQLIGCFVFHFQEGGFVTFNVFFANAIVLVLVMFVVGAVKAITMQYFYHLTTIEGMHVKSALQVRLMTRRDFLQESTFSHCNFVLWDLILCHCKCCILNMLTIELNDHHHIDDKDKI